MTSCCAKNAQLHCINHQPLRSAQRRMKSSSNKKKCELLKIVWKLLPIGNITMENHQVTLELTLNLCFDSAEFSLIDAPSVSESSPGGMAKASSSLKQCALHRSSSVENFEDRQDLRGLWTQMTQRTHVNNVNRCKQQTPFWGASDAMPKTPKTSAPKKVTGPHAPRYDGPEL